MSSTAQLAGALLESDAAYFEAGARIEPLPGAGFAWIQGLNPLSAAGVITRIEPGLGGLEPADWLATAEAAVQRTGRSEVRLYLTGPHPTLESLLRGRGYRSRIEWGMLRSELRPRAPTGAGRVTVAPVRSEADWRLKAALHETLERGPDGHPTAAGLWTDLERRKVEAGYMRPYLASCDGEVCGAFALSRRASLFRLKNLVLHPDRRRRGIGAALIEMLVDLTGGGGGQALGAFAVEGSEGEQLYRKCGFMTITSQTEWIGTLCG